MELLKQLCGIHAPAGSEAPLTDFVLNYIQANKKGWKVQPEIFHGDGFQDCIVLVFGKPKTAIFAHLDSIGFTVKYDNEIVKIGGPITKDGIELIGEDSQGKIDSKLTVKEDENSAKTFHLVDRPIDRLSLIHI